MPHLCTFADRRLKKGVAAVGSTIFEALNCIGMKIPPHLSLTFLLVFGLSTVLWAQGRPGGFSGALSGALSGGNRTSTLGPVVLDTSEIHYFHADAPWMVFPFGDSLLDDFHQYDPIRRQSWPWANLGNLGSAARPLFYQPHWRRGFDVGFHQYDLYQMSPADVRFYRITQAYTNTAYTQGPLQTDAQMLVQFSRNFSDGINLSIEHRRINNGGAYDHQRATNSTVAAGLWWHEPLGRYDGFLTFISNTHLHEENGGAAESLTDTIIPPFQVDVHLSSPFTRHAHAELAFTQYFYLNRLGKAQRETLQQQRNERRQARRLLPERDTLSTKPPQLAPPTDRREVPANQTRPPTKPLTANAERPDAGPPAPSPLPVGKRTFTIIHRASWKSSTYKFADASPDSSYYGPLLLDDRGLRVYLQTRRLESSIGLLSFKLRQARDSIALADRFEVGLVHTLWLFDQEPLPRQTFHDLFFTGRLEWQPTSAIYLGTYAHLGLGHDAGDFRLEGHLQFNMGALGRLDVGLVNQLFSPPLLAERFYVTSKPLWNQSLNRTFESSLTGSWTLPRLLAGVRAGYHLLDNLVYFGEDGYPRQSGSFSIWQAALTKHFHLPPFHLENEAGIQRIGSIAFQGPPFFSHHHLYAEGRIFKKVMLARVGTEAHLFGAYEANGYLPLIGQFTTNETETIPFTPLVDVYLSFRVKTFRFFLRIDNVLTRPLRTYHFLTRNYPLPFGFNNGGIRFGISWRLVD